MRLADQKQPTTLIAVVAVAFLVYDSATAAEDRVELLGSQTSWRSHVIFRPAVVGSAEKHDEDADPPPSWRYTGGDFASKPPPEDWTEPDFDDSA